MPFFGLVSTNWTEWSTGYLNVLNAELIIVSEEVLAGPEIPGGGWGKRRGRLYLSLYCHQQNDSCIKIGSDDNHLNVSLILRDKVTK